MIETIDLTEQQVQQLANADIGHPWMQMTDEQNDFIKACGDSKRCTFIGNRLVRMPVVDFDLMLKNAFRASFFHAMYLLDIKDQNLISDVEMADFKLGDAYFSVTLTLADGRRQTGRGFLCLPEDLLKQTVH